jgi:hypothetical protein
VRRVTALGLLLLALAGCARSREVVVPPSAEQPTDVWRALVTADDRDRLRHWRDTFTQALAKAQPAFQAAITAEGPLLDPDAGLENARPPAGTYRCRALKIGAQDNLHPDFVADPPGQCRIETGHGRLHFQWLAGPQRPRGIIFPDTGRRMVLLGTMQFGDEALAIRYGYDKERDVLGIVERIGEARWRIILPAPHFEAKLEVIELVPQR